MSWFCVYTAIASEFKAMAGLKAHDFQCYLPLLSRRRQISGRVVTRTSPLLARYIFVCIPREDLAAVHTIRGVQEVLPHELEPIAVPACDIERLQERERNGEFVFRDTARDQRRLRKILKSFRELAILSEQEYLHAS